jgi:hypothetical protein
MSVIHHNGQKVKVHYEENGEHYVKSGRLYGGYTGEGAVTITVSQDRRVTFPANRVLYVEDIRSIREDS